MQDDRAREPGERGARVVVGRARVDHDRLAELGCQLELRREDPVLRLGRRVVAEPVEPDLPDGDRLRVALEAAQLVDGGCVDALGLVRVDAEDRVDARRAPRRARARGPSRPGRCRR